MSDLAFRRLVLLASGAFFLLHILLSLLFSFPEIPTSPLVKKVVFRYMFPFFNQNNRVFAPEPPLYSQDLEYSLYQNGRWFEFRSFSDSLIDEHHSHRISSLSTQCKLADYQFRQVYDALLLSDYYANRDEGYDKRQTDSIRYGRFSRSEAAKIGMKYLQKKGFLDPRNTDSLRFRAVLQYPPEPGSGRTPKPILIESPAIALEK